MRYPEYMKEFKCIGGKCTDSCCIGWDIDIDKTSFKQYYKVQDKEMRRMFQKNLRNNDNYQSSNVDYGKVKLKSGKRCPFLDDENLCIIYSKLGEEYLSNVCTCFPRITNKVDNDYEMSLDIACPEAARIILLNENKIIFKESQENLGKHIISANINTKDKQFNHSAVKYFKEIRDISIKIIQHRNLNISRRLYILGEFLERLEEELKINYSNVPKFIKKYAINSVVNYNGKNRLDYLKQMDFFKRMLDLLNVSRKVDSLTFKKYTNEIILGFELDSEDNISHDSEVYIEAFEKYSEKYMESHSYIFENYLVNFIYNNIFPFSEDESVFQGYMMLLIRYSFIRFYLVGKYLINGQDSKEKIVEFIQLFSKTIEHHNSYLVDSANYIKENKLDNMKFAKILI